MKKQFIIMNGHKFKEQTNYVVEVSMNSGNPIFQDLFYTGFLNGKNNTPGGYNQLFTSCKEIKDVYYMKVIREIDASIDNTHKMVKDVLIEDYPEYVI